MNSILQKMGGFVRDLLSISESFIKIGRYNFEDDNFETSYISIDTLTPSKLLSSASKFDGDEEEEAYSQNWLMPVILTFWGNNAYTNANKFSLLLPSQKALELSSTLGIDVLKVTNFTDVRLLAGKQYNNRLELNLNILYTISASVDTLRIDTAQVEILTEKDWEVTV